MSRKSCVTLLLVIASALLAIGLFIAGAIWRGRATVKPATSNQSSSSFLRPFALSSMPETPSRIQGRESCRPWNQTPAPSLFFVVHRPYDETGAQCRQFRPHHLNKQQSSNHPIWFVAQLSNAGHDMILLLHETHWETIWEQLDPNQSQNQVGTRA